MDSTLHDHPNSALKPVDHNDPHGAEKALQILIPVGFNDRAHAVLKYLVDTATFFYYKEQLVLTDESLALTDYEGPDIYERAPEKYIICVGPRWTGNTMQELEDFLIACADILDKEEPGWDEEF